MSSNRRQFTRVLFEAEAQLSAGEESLQVRLIDLSLKGALVRPLREVFLQIGTPCTLTITLGKDGMRIVMQATLAHHEGLNFGLSCRDIDLDSMTHLRRLVELNLGDDTLLNRELSALSA